VPVALAPFIISRVQGRPSKSNTISSLFNELLIRFGGGRETRVEHSPFSRADPPIPHDGASIKIDQQPALGLPSHEEQLPGARPRRIVVRPRLRMTMAGLPFNGRPQRSDDRTDGNAGHVY
jgi:hypothetical protein